MSNTSSGILVVVPLRGIRCLDKMFSVPFTIFNYIISVFLFMVPATYQNFVIVTFQALSISCQAALYMRKNKCS